MADDDKKIDYSKIKTHGGVTVDKDGEAHATALSDQSRAAHVQALKDELGVLKGRADNGDESAKRRLSQVEKQLDRFGDRPSSRASKETAGSQPPARPAS